MKLGIKITSNVERMMDQLGEDIRGGLKAGTTNVVEQIEARAVENAPVITSDLVNSITSEVSEDGRTGIVRATARHAQWVHDGTGLYGPHKQKIVPKNKKALNTPYGPRKSVKGQKPQPFLADAAAAVDPQQAFETGMENFLRKKGHVK